MLFRRTDKYGYSRYYGNGGPALVIKIVVCILALIVILLGVATLVLKQYMVYTENGGHLELPWSTSDGSLLASDVSESSEGDSSEGDTSLPAADASTSNTDDGDGSDSSGGDGTEGVTSELDPLVGDLLIQHVSISNVISGNAASDLEDAGANGIMLFMKESGGALNYHSQLSMSATLGASTSTSRSTTIQNTIESLNEDGYYTLAYLNCFDDDMLSDEDGFALTNSDGETVTASNGVGWVDPSQEDAQEYLLGIVADMAEMGFDEIVLYDACYPYGDTADGLDLDSDETEAVITAFYEALADVAAEYDVLVSVVVDPAVILGEESTSGQTLESLLALGGHVWVMEDEADDLDALNDALNAAGFPENALSVVADTLESDSGYNYLNQD